MQIDITKWILINETQPVPPGQEGAPLRKVAVVAVVRNPFKVGQADLSAGIVASAALGSEMARQLATVFLLDEVRSYGKAGLVGVNGEQEHANALLTTTFANPLRDAIGGAKAWIPSVTKVGPAGTAIDVPLAHKDALYVRSHYDTLTLSLAQAPLPDEIALIFAVANRGRINARVGGLHADDVVGKDGLT
ncbi:amino acid synthesis family protein [Bordetella sp. N]|uniref:amino acid synthesis family protein n=1 Tax=Bordetella sp. N TaxID=1746199 RepID=UPI000710959E|nr:amino acid synthesis family protein [Bordetella sp. N]ALM81851.1 hypothetical protein ASB57_01725 [Bordetella sp. N]